MLAFYKNELKWLSLKYKQGNIEKLFQLERESYQRWTLLLFFSMFTIISLILWAVGLGSPNQFTISKIIANVVRFFLVILIRLLVNNFPKRIEEFIMIILSLSTMTYVELNRNSLNIIDSADIYLYGLLMQTINTLAILLRVNYVRLVILLFFNNLFAALRFFQIENLDWLSMKALILMSSNFIFLASFAYGKEIYERKVNFDLISNQNSLTLYEKMIKEIIPVSIIIYDDKNLFFTNELEKS